MTNGNVLEWCIYCVSLSKKRDVRVCVCVCASPCVSIVAQLNAAVERLTYYSVPIPTLKIAVRKIGVSRAELFKLIYILHIYCH